MAYCPKCNGARQIKTTGGAWDICNVCDGLGDVDPAVDQVFRESHGMPTFADAEETLVSCMRCLHCEVCGGRHMTSRTRNDAYRQRLREKAIAAPGGGPLGTGGVRGTLAGIPGGPVGVGGGPVQGGPVRGGGGAGGGGTGGRR